MRSALCGVIGAYIALSIPLAANAQAGGDPRLDRESARAVQALLDSARAEHLPASALTGVLQEGLSQHANGTRIVRAMQDYLRAIRGAAAALGPASSETELVSGAGAVLAGVPAAALGQIRAARGKESVVVPLVVLGDLVARGVPAAAAGNAIADATKRGVPDQELNTLRERVEHDIASGMAASVALESVTRRFSSPSATPSDSAARRRKPPGDYEGFARLELNQLSGGSTGALREFRADARLPFGQTSAFQFAGDARALDGAALTGPGALVNAAFLAATTSRNSGLAAGPGARLISTSGRAWVSPALQASAWHTAGAWRLSLDAAFAGVPVRSSATTTQGLSWTKIPAVGEARFDVVQNDTPIVHGTPTPPPSSTPFDSSSQNSSTMVPGTATEARFAISRTLGRFEFEGSAGIRSYSARRTDTWSAATVAATLFDRVGVVAGGVFGAENLLAPVGGSRFFAGIRLATGPSFVTAPARTDKNELAFRVIPGGVTTTLEIRAPGARSVEIVGDFTDWVPLSMTTAGDGKWSVTRAIASGVHRVRVRINAGGWSAPPGLPRSLDLFGGEVGVLTIGTL